jgi:O-phosphoseryl-tRNA(Cys) synthetase
LASADPKGPCSLEVLNHQMRETRLQTTAVIEEVGHPLEKPQYFMALS